MLIRMLVFLVFLLMTLGSGSGAQAGERYCSDTNARNLKLEMYPFVPDANRIALRIKELFEAGCPGLDLQIDMNQNYYSTGSAGILSAKADVYEVDSVFFDDFLKQRKPKLPSQSLLARVGPTIPFAKNISIANGKQYGVPHWVCTDFLIYKKSFSQIGAIKSPADAAKVFAQLGKGLLMDLQGSSTLGELYLSVMVAHYGSTREALRRIDPDNLDEYAVNVLRDFVLMEPAGFGRDRDYHGREGFYARQLARGSGGAFVGYSEDTHYALTETAQSCQKGECLSEDDLDIAQWPFADEGAKPVAWVDMYMLDSRLAGTKLRDAEALVKFLMRVSTYEVLLLPPDSPPMYLLPARDDVYPKLAAAKLYPKFRALIDSATPVTQEGLNDKLHKVAGSLNAKLPASH
jgi:thiamine pyridinylase